MKESYLELKQFLMGLGFDEVSSPDPKELFFWSADFRRDSILVRIDHDPNGEFLSIGIAEDQPRWFELTYLRQLLCGNSWRRQGDSIDVMIPFLKEHWGELMNALGPNRYEETKVDYQKLVREISLDEYGFDIGDRWP